MTTRPALTAQRREIAGKAVARLRQRGILPAVVYGHGVPSENIQLDAKEFDSVRRAHGRNALIDLRVDRGRPRPVLVHGVQEHPVRRVPIHVDFYVVNLTEELTVEVPLVPVGESIAVDKHGGTLLQAIDHVRVRALPADLPQSIEYDISVLDSFDVHLHVRDLVIPPKVTLLTDLDEPLAHVQASRAEVAEEAEAAAAAPAAEAVPEAETAAPTAE